MGIAWDRTHRIESAQNEGGFHTPWTALNTRFSSQIGVGIVIVIDLLPQKLRVRASLIAF
jgi:hypothetical protein